MFEPLVQDPVIARWLDAALAEDLGDGDVTTEATVAADARGTAEIVAKQDLVFAGAALIESVLQRLDSDARATVFHKDGASVSTGERIATLDAGTRALLSSERLILNLLMRLSGIATQTNDMIAALGEHTRVKLLDTRKTTPGMRRLEKAAVRAGGGQNHRFALYDGVLIKDNHILAAGGIAAAVHLARRHAHHLLKIEVEIAEAEQIEPAIIAGADALLLDNMDETQLRHAVETARQIKADVFIEASGNMSRERLAAVANCGVDAISMGAITHSVKAADLSMHILADATT